MSNTKQTKAKQPSKKRRPALTPEARENQLISLAVDLAEQQLMDGTATSQVITHYLKLGSSKNKLEQEILKEQAKLIKAKTENLEAIQRQDELYKEALEAMRRYSPQNWNENDDEQY